MNGKNQNQDNRCLWRGGEINEIDEEHTKKFNCKENLM